MRAMLTLGIVLRRRASGRAAARGVRRRVAQQLADWVAPMTRARAVFGLNSAACAWLQTTRGARIHADSHSHPRPLVAPVVGRHVEGGWRRRVP